MPGTTEEVHQSIGTRAVLGQQRPQQQHGLPIVRSQSHHSEGTYSGLVDMIGSTQQKKQEEKINGSRDCRAFSCRNMQGDGGQDDGHTELVGQSGEIRNNTCGESSVPVYVMLPLDTVNAEGVFRYGTASWFVDGLKELKKSGIHGVAVDVWWGAVERKPRKYDFSGYRQLFDLLMSMELKIQVVLAFHACGGNVGDNAEVPLPPWVLAAGERDPDMFYTDRPREFSPGRRNPECLSLFADEEQGILRGRSPIQCYVDFMKAFRDEFLVLPEASVPTTDGVVKDMSECIAEIVLGTGPCGELRYPSYPETNGWRFPGIGEFQCYDRRALASLARAAEEVGHPEWGHSGPQDVGHYNSCPEDTAFFRTWNGIWNTEYGRFFLSWYSKALIDHGERMLQAAASVFCIRNLNTASSSQMYRAQSDTVGSSDMEGLSFQITKDDQQNVNNNDIIGMSESSTPRDPQSEDARKGSPRDSESDPGVYPNAQGFASRGPSYASFRSSSVSESLNAMEEWVWPTPSGTPVHMNLKMAGVHWWYHTRSHAAELTAGYYHCEDYNGYEDILALCAQYRVGLTLTCVEMCDSQHPPEALCGPEGLLRTVKEAAVVAGVPLAGENALPCFMPNAIDEDALKRIVYNTQPLGTPLEEEIVRERRVRSEPSLVSATRSNQAGKDFVEHDDTSGRYLPPMRSFTFLRMAPEMMSAAYQSKWSNFMKFMSKNALRFKGSQKYTRLGFSE